MKPEVRIQEVMFFLLESAFLTLQVDGSFDFGNNKKHDALMFVDCTWLLDISNRFCIFVRNLVVSFPAIGLFFCEGRLRLETAVRAAKSAGVSAEHLA